MLSPMKVFTILLTKSHDPPSSPSLAQTIECPERTAEGAEVTKPSDSPEAISRPNTKSYSGGVQRRVLQAERTLHAPKK